MTQTRARVFGLFFILTLVLSVAAFAAKPNTGSDATPATIGEISISASAIQWPASGTYDRLVLTVSGPENFSFSREFESGRVVSLRVQDLGAKMPADGSYTWELRVVPRVSADVKRRLAEARQKDDEAGAARIQAQAGLNHVISESGSFTIGGGMFVGGGSEAEGPGSVSASALKPKPLDQVYADDIIVQGSACIGLDCVNNESFGFDTIRMKENNTRIKFEDTSTGAGFPTTDWQLTANDSASGGASKFSIEDITGAKVPFTITAGAATNSIFVDSTGRLGLRTSTPVLDIHVSTGNTPAMRLEQTSAAGFTAQTWDVAGNEANFFVRDVTGGSRLPFRIRPGAPTSSIDIAADGDVGIGTASPWGPKLAITGSDGGFFNAIGAINTNTAGSAFIYLGEAANATTPVFIQHYGSTHATKANFFEIGQANAAPMTFLTNSVERMRIDSGGAVTISGNLTVTGVKNFAMVDPGDSKKAIYYAALEGPEAGTYFRGTAKTVNGEAVIELPGSFARVTERERMTVQLTAVGSWSQVYVAEKSPERLVIRVAKDSPDLEFDYLVQGVRKGYLDYVVERENKLPN
ncbi:MAG: hypothetical protein AABO58_08180 [Acidobacteriota bacterium]